MARITYLQNEKSLMLSKLNTYVLVIDDLQVDINKIELAKKLKEQKLVSTGIRVVTLPRKFKNQNSKKGGKKMKVVSRAKKFYVTLAAGQKIDEKFEIII